VNGPSANVRYIVVCIVLGLALGWLPALVHGPIPEKWDVYGVRGATLVWGYYVARASIGLLVGITGVPSAWYLRGPLCGLLVMLPLGFVGLANPLCGPPCMFWNSVTAAAIGFAVGALAWAITGKHHARDGQ